MYNFIYNYVIKYTEKRNQNPLAMSDGSKVKYKKKDFAYFATILLKKCTELLS